MAQQSDYSIVEVEKIVLDSNWRILMNAARELRAESTRWHGGSFNMAADFVEQKAIGMRLRKGITNV